MDLVWPPKSYWVSGKGGGLAVKSLTLYDTTKLKNVWKIDNYVPVNLLQNFFVNASIKLSASQKRHDGKYWELFCEGAANIES